MAKNKFLELLENDIPLIADGAMGTVLHGRGEGFEGCFDALNLDNPALVADVHKAYIDAGAQFIMTNTFGANRYKLAEHGLEDKVQEINCAAAQLAKRVVEASFKDVLVAGVKEQLRLIGLLDKCPRGIDVAFPNEVRIRIHGMHLHRHACGPNLPEL